MKVTVTKGKYPTGTEYLLVTCYPLPGKRGKRKFCRDQQAVDEFITEVDCESSESRAIPERLKLEARDCDRILQPHGWTLQRAVDYVVQNVIPFEKKPPVREAVAFYLGEQEARGLAKETLWDLKYRMGVFAAKFGDRHLHELTIDDYSKWMKDFRVDQKEDGSIARNRGRFRFEPGHLERGVYHGGQLALR